MPNLNQTLFIVIFALIGLILVLLTYVCWLKRMKRQVKEEILADQHRREQQELTQALSPSEIQQLKPVLLQQLFAQDLQRQRAAANENPFEDTPQYTPLPDAHMLVNIHDSSETDATIIHTGQETNNRRTEGRR
ncbi:hypothetical protein EDC96DRAFT_566413 [Choanephora cucurbitarum]|nr:hypothetical protein EDC96DRAFT_566413 [Choanephora cucurbitarum]